MPLHLLLRPSPFKSKSLLLSRSLPAIFSNTFSSSLPLPHLSPLRPPNPNPNPNPDPMPTSTDIAAAFHDWLLSSATSSSSVASLLDEIYHALASSPDDSSASAALESLRLPLSEQLVLSVLRHRPRVGAADDRLLLLLRLRFFDWSGRRPNYRHSRAVYHSIFRLLTRSRRVSVVLDWLRLFSSSASDSPSSPTPPLLPSTAAPAFSHPRFHDTLVVGYAVAGEPELALRLLGRMRFHGLDLDAFSSHVLLNSLVDASLHSFADSLAAHLSSHRNGLDPVATCIRIKSLCLRGRLDDAESLLRTLPPPAAARGPATGAVIAALCRRGRFADAARLVEEFPSAEVYGSFVHALVSAGRLDATLEFLAAKKAAEGYIPESNWYDELTYRLLRGNRLGDVYDLLVQMMEEGIAPGRATMNAVLCFFCKAGFVDVAMHLYKSRMELGINPNAPVYNDLIRALCRGGDTDEACQVLEEAMANGHFPGHHTFGMLTSVLCRERKLDKARELLDGALKLEVRPMNAVLAKYLVMLCKTGNVEEACTVPQMVSRENAGGLYRYSSTYASLIRAFILMRRVDVLPRLVMEMQDMGHLPSRSLYQSVVCTLCEMGRYAEVLELLDKQLERKELDACTCYNYFISGAGRAKKPDMAWEVYNRMENAGIRASADSNILLLLSYLRSKRIGDALNFFNILREQGVPGNKLYNVFITGLCKVGKPEQAMVFWREAKEKGVVLSMQCYEELVFVLSSFKDYDSVVKVIDDFRETGRPVSPFLCNVLLLHTMKSRDLLKAWFRSRDGFREAEDVSEEIQDRRSGRLLLGQLIARFSRGIRMREDLGTLEEAIERCFPIDVYTYNMLLRALTMAGNMESACNMFEKLCNKGYQPNRWTFDIMVHGFCKDGNRKEAERWMEAMYRHGFFPTWYTMRLYNNMEQKQKVISFV